MGSLQTLPRGAARGNAPLVTTFAGTPSHCYRSCGRRPFAQSLYEYTYERTSAIPAGIFLVRVGDGPFCPLPRGHICYSVVGTKIRQFCPLQGEADESNTE